MDEYIGYSGEVIVTTKCNGCVIDQKTTHNAGQSYLFQYLVQCLVGVGGVLANKPQQIAVVEINGTKSVIRPSNSLVGKDGDVYYAEISATFVSGDFADAFQSDNNGKVQLKMYGQSDEQWFADATVDNFTDLKRGQSVTVVWRMKFQNITTSSAPTRARRAKPTAQTNPAEVEVIHNA